MTRTTRSTHVDTYLAQLDAALAHHGHADREVITESVREHIDSALAEREPTPENIAAVLRALGDPSAIAADAAGIESTAAASSVPLSRRWVPPTAVLLASVSALGLVFILPAIVVLVGIAMLWISPLWTNQEKAWATLVLPLPGVVFAVLGMVDAGGAGLTVLGAAVVACVWAGVLLTGRGVHRAKP